MTLASIEFLIISAGLSFDIFGEIACKGALLPKINWKRLVGICIVMALWQTCALFVGRFFGTLLYQIDTRANADRAGRIIAAGIFIILGIRMLWKAYKNKPVEERRVDTIPYSTIIKLLATITLYTLLAGFAVGFLIVNVTFIIPTIAMFTALAVVIGIYIGYHFGAAFQRGTNIAGGICYLIISVDIVIRYILFK